MRAATCFIQMCVPNGNLEKAREKQADTPERRVLLKFFKEVAESRDAVENGRSDRIDAHCMKMRSVYNDC